MHPDLLLTEATARQAAALGAAQRRRHRRGEVLTFRVPTWQEALGRVLVSVGTSLQCRPLGLRRSTT